MSAVPPAAAANAGARRPWSIRAQLVALVIAVTLPAAGIVTYALADAASEARQAAFAQVRYLGTAMADRLQDILRKQTALLAHAAQRERIRALDPRRCDPLFESIGDIAGPQFRLTLRDRSANVVCTSTIAPLPAAVVAKLPWFVEGVSRARPWVSPGFRHPDTGRWVSVVSHPVYGDDGDVAGILNLTLDLSLLQEEIFEGLPAGALVTVLDGQGTFLMRSVDPEHWIGKSLPEANASRAASRRAGETYETVGVDGVTRLYAYAEVPAARWRVFAALPAEAVLAGHRDRLYRSAAIGFVTVLLVVILAYAIGSAIARPIGELARAASNLAGGERLSGEPARGTAEVEAVAGQLARLAAERERQRGDRAALVAHYERLLKTARDIYLLIDADYRIADFNDAALETYGHAPEALRGMPMAMLRAPEVRDSIERDWLEADRPGGGLFETVHQRRDGSRFPVEVSSRAFAIDGVLYRQAFVRDISARKAAEETLRRQNAELDRFNRAAVGRELEIVALKQRVNALSREAGREPPFPLAFLDAADRGGSPP